MGAIKRQGRLFRWSVLTVSLLVLGMAAASPSWAVEPQNNPKNPFSGASAGEHKAKPAAPVEPDNGARSSAQIASNASVPSSLASADADVPGWTAEVTELKRNKGGTVTLKFIINNATDKSIKFADGAFADPQLWSGHKNIGGVTLMDPVNKKKYLVLRDADKNCLCSDGITYAAPKSKINLWAKYPAPPEDVKEITVMIPHFMPMDDVPIN